MKAYTLEVYGYLWEGSRGCYSYPLTAPITTDEEAKRAAGDFASVIDWRLVECQHTHTRSTGGVYRHVEERRTLRGFRNGMTPQRFARFGE